MRLDQFKERDQDRIVSLAIRQRNDIVEWKSEQVEIPQILNSLFVCSNFDCRITRDVIYYRNDILDGNVATRVRCYKCGQFMTRKFIGTDVTNVLKKYLKQTDEYGKEGLSQWFDGIDDD